jgi:hypothetical protein
MVKERVNSNFHFFCHAMDDAVTAILCLEGEIKRQTRYLVRYLARYNGNSRDSSCLVMIAKFASVPTYLNLGIELQQTK